MSQLKWFDRSFDFGSPQNTFPLIIERLAGTPARLEEKVSVIPAALLPMRPSDQRWTIQENIGHLSDLEPLWQGRLEDILAGRAELRTTDLQNRRTSEANHNSTPVTELLGEFRLLRTNTIRMIRELQETQIFMSSLHPRLKTPMRTIDHFLFVAEHDDHHLARMTELVKLFSL